MTKRIFKYGIIIRDEFSISMPIGAEILSVKVQHGIPQLWAIVDDHQADKESRTFKVYGTGHVAPESGTFIDTFLMCDDDLVWHLFETS